MEVRLEAVGILPPEDTFVSFRVGDVQKQSRFAKNRTYRFPDPGGGRDRFGRLEVFRRVGSLTVNFAVEGGQQEVNVPCDLPGLQHLGMRVAVKGGGSGSKPPALPSVEQREQVEVKGKVHKRMDAAQRYMSEHRLEEILADAMREVLQAKPEDPLFFLSNQLLKHRKPSVQETLPPVNGVVGIQAPTPPPTEKPQTPVARQKAPTPTPPLTEKPASRQKARERLPPIERAEEPPSKAREHSIERVEELPTKAVAPLAPLLPPPPATKDASGFPGTGPTAPTTKRTPPPLVARQRTMKIPEVPMEAVEAERRAKEERRAAEARAAAAPPPLQEPLGSGAYYVAHILNASGPGSTAGLAGLHNKFAAARASKPDGASAPEGFAGYYTANLLATSGPSSTSGLASLYNKFATVVKREGFGAYYTANLLATSGPSSTSGLASLHNKFATAVKREGSAVPHTDAELSKPLQDLSFEALRVRAKETLTQASVNGSLTHALSKTKQKAKEDTSLDTLRMRCKSTLARATLDGSLAAVLSKRPKQTAEEDLSFEAMRVGARKSLTQASLDGSLAAVLAKMSKQNAEEDCGFGNFYRAHLLTTSASVPMQDLLGKFEDLSFEAMREGAQKSLTQASLDGSLAAVLTKMSKQSAEEEGGFGNFYRAHLLSTSASAPMQDLLSKFKAKDLSFEAVREGAQKSLTQASLDGSLAAVLTKMSKQSAEEDLSFEAMREGAQKSLTQASLDGSLAAVLTKMSKQSAEEESGFGNFYRAHLLSTSASAPMQDLLSKFEAKDLLSKFEAKASPVYAAMPSVGTWILRKPRRLREERGSSGGELLSLAVPQAPALPVGGFSPYYSSNFLAGSTTQGSIPKAMQDLMSKFSAPPAPAATTVAAPAALAPQAAKPIFAYRASVGSWLVRTPAKVTIPEQIGEGLEKVAEVSAAEAPKAIFIHRASVGSWLMRMPAKVHSPHHSDSSDEEVAKAAKAIEAPKSTFTYRPSVGSWLTRTPAKVPLPWYYQQHDGPNSLVIQTFQQAIAQRDREVEDLQHKLRTASRGKPVKEQAPLWEEPAPMPTAKPDTEALAGTRPTAAVATFKNKPSVGTWLSYKPKKLQDRSAAAAAAQLASQPLRPSPTAASPQEGPWNYRASVGSWLARRGHGPADHDPGEAIATPMEIEIPVKAVQEPEPMPTILRVSPQRTGLLARRQDSLLEMKPVQLLEAFQAELEAKDRQIEELKKLLATLPPL